MKSEKAKNQWAEYSSHLQVRQVTYPTTHSDYLSPTGEDVTQTQPFTGVLKNCDLTIVLRPLGMSCHSGIMVEQ
jgi:hypothetical protein